MVSDHNEIKLDDIGNLKASKNPAGITENMMKHFILLQTEVNLLATLPVFDLIGDQLKIDNMTIWYDDRGSVNKVLDIMRKRTG